MLANIFLSESSIFKFLNLILGEGKKVYLIFPSTKHCISKVEQYFFTIDWS